MNKKKVSKPLLYTYLKDSLNSNYNFQLTDVQMERLIEGLENSIKSLIMDRYSFRFLGFSFDVEPKPAYVYMDVNDKKIKTSDPYYCLKIRIPQRFKKELKEHTRYKSLDEPLKINSLKKKI